MALGRQRRGGKRSEGVEELTPEQVLTNCENYLKAKETDWDSLYIRIRMSALGNDFPREVFVRTPIHIIRRVLKEIDNAEQAEANINSMSTARLTEVVLHIAHGFSGSKKRMPKTKVTEYLPFPNWHPEEETKSEIDEHTKKILIQLARKRVVPMHVFASLLTPPTE